MFIYAGLMFCFLGFDMAREYFIKKLIVESNSIVKVEVLSVLKLDQTLSLKFQHNEVIHYKDIPIKYFSEIQNCKEIDLGHLDEYDSTFLFHETPRLSTLVIGIIAFVVGVFAALRGIFQSNEGLLLTDWSLKRTEI